MADKLVATLDKAGVRKISTDLWGVSSKTSAIRAMAGSTANSCKTARSNTTVRISPSGATTPLGARSCPPARSPHSVWGRPRRWPKRTRITRLPKSARWAASRLLTRLCLGRFGPIPDGFGLYPRSSRSGKPRFRRHGVPRRRDLRFSIWTRAHGKALPVQVALIGDDGKPLAATVVTAPASNACGEWTSFAPN